MKNEEFEIRGSYSTGCFNIFINGDFDLNLSNLSTRDLGTFLHEYVHFLQNISTPYGIYSAILLNNNICEFVHSIKNKEEIILPYKYDLSEELSLQNKWYKCSLGTGHLNSVIDKNKPTKFSFEKIEGFPIDMHVVNYEVYVTNSLTPINIIIGSTIIKESMSAMYQSLIDKELYHYDVPYNVIRILCEKHFSNIALDIKKLICLCYISLFSLDPGYLLIHLLKEANQNPSLTGFQIFENFMQNSRIKISNENICYSYNKLVEKYKESISKLLPCDLKYIEILLERVKIKDGIVPILNVLNCNDFNEKNIKSLIDYLGIPFIHQRDGKQFYPQLLEVEHSCQDVISMVGISTMYNYFMNPNDFVCPFKYMCDCNEFECFNEPWEIKGCIFDLGIDAILARGVEIVKTENNRVICDNL
jgi:hypothetical protein